MRIIMRKPVRRPRAGGDPAALPCLTELQTTLGPHLRGDDGEPGVTQ